MIVFKYDIRSSYTLSTLPVGVRYKRGPVVVPESERFDPANPAWKWLWRAAVTVDDIVALIERHRYTVACELELHEAIAMVLRKARPRTTACRRGRAGS